MAGGNKFKADTPQRSRKPGDIPDPKRKVSKRRAKEICNEFLPKRRTAYALYVRDKYPNVRATLPNEGRSQNQAVKIVSQMWASLSEAEKQPYLQQEAQEKRQRQQALESLFPDAHVPGGNCQMLQDDATMGNFRVDSAGQALWQGAAAAAFKATHKVMLFDAMVITFQQQADFEHEVKILKRLDGHALFCRVFEICEAGPIRGIIQESLPTVHHVLEQRGGFKGHELQKYGQQLALAVHHLHTVGFFHGDIKPKAAFFSAEQGIVKLARFSLAVAVDSVDDADSTEPTRYTGNYRPPEFWTAKSAAGRRVTCASEAFAYGATLAEMGTGKILFDNVQDLLNFNKSRGCGLGKYVPFQSLSDSAAHVVSEFLQPPESRLTIQKFLSSPTLMAKLGE